MEQRIEGENMELSQQDKYLIVVGIIFCIALAVLSPYIASGDPDGLEKSAEDAAVGEDVEQAVITLALGLGIGYALKKTN